MDAPIRSGPQPFSSGPDPTINRSLERYYFDNGSLPADTAALSAYFPDGVPNCPVSGNAYSLDATTKRVTNRTGTTHP